MLGSRRRRAARMDSWARLPVLQCTRPNGVLQHSARPDHHRSRGTTMADTDDSTHAPSRLRRPATDITGRKFGYLTALRRVGESGQGFSSWECRCDCGTVKIIRRCGLISGGTLSCGCQRSRLIAATHFHDITGKVFYCWTVLYRHGTSGNKWACQCVCGTKRIVLSHNLQSGHSKSCGCAQADNLVGKRFGKLRVLRRAGSDCSWKPLWVCHCECGQEKTIRGSDMRRGRISSCGCLAGIGKNHITQSWQEREARSVSVQNSRARRVAALGSYSKSDVDDLYKVQRGRCAGCESKIRRGGFDVDHIMPLSLGGRNDRKNLQLLCQSCNCRKGAKHPIEWAQRRGFLL